MSLSFDGSFVTGYSETSSSGSVVTSALSTSLSNDIVIVDVFNEAATAQGSAPTVTGIALTGVTTWTKKQSFQPAAYFGVSNAWYNIERWWGLAESPISEQTITVTMSTVGDAVSVISYAINGANTTTPFDVNASASVQDAGNVGGFTNPTVGPQSTTAANTVLLPFRGSVHNTSQPSATNSAGGTVSIIEDFNPVASTATNNCWCVSAQQIVSLAQSGDTFTFVNNEPGWIAIVDAIQQASGGGAARPPTLTLMGVG